MRVWPDGLKIRESMEARGWAQLDLAEESGLARGTIENCTCDHPRSVYPRTLKKIADALDVDVTVIRALGPGAGGEPAAGPAAPRGRVCLGRPLPETRAGTFIGRAAELARLSAAWANPREHLICVVAVGGQGKTALIKRWLAANPPEALGAAVVLVWSLDGQGQDEGDPRSGSDAFLSAAWGCLFPDRDLPMDWLRCADHLAERLQSLPALLVLDGIEVLQTPAGSAAGGCRLPDGEPVLRLLRHLAEGNAGLVVLSSRCPIANLRDFRETTVPELHLAPFDRGEGIDLLRALRVRGDDEDLDGLTQSLWGHPLSLDLLGGYLAATGQEVAGDASLASLLEEAGREGGDPGGAVVAAYERWLGAGPERDLLRLLALFDVPAGTDLLADLGRSPAIEGITDYCAGLPRRGRLLALERLRRLGLAATVGEGDAAAYVLHPAVRAVVRARLRAGPPGPWRAAQARIYRRLLAAAPREPVELEDLGPLYAPLEHGLEAGLHREVFDEVVWVRLLQGYPALALQKFNAGARDYAALCGFFHGDPPDPARPRCDDLDPGRRGRLCWWGGLVLTLHGQHAAAIAFFDAAVVAFEAAGDRLSVPMAQLYKCHCLLYEGQVDTALDLAEAAVAQLRSEECSISVWARQARYVMGTIGAVILQLGYRAGKTVPLHLRVGLFSQGQVLHAAGRLDEAAAAFESALRSPLPAGAREWDLFLVQDGWYLEHLIATGAQAQAKDYIRDHINRYEDSRLAEAMAAISLARMRIETLYAPEAVDDLAEQMENTAEALDSRTKPHLIRALLELAARARELGDLGLAESLLGQARDACAAANIGLLEVDCLLEEGWIKLHWGQLHATTQLQMAARARIEAGGYRLRLDETLRLAAALERRGG